MKLREEKEAKQGFLQRQSHHHHLLPRHLKSSSSQSLDELLDSGFTTEICLFMPSPSGFSKITFIFSPLSLLSSWLVEVGG